MTFPQNPHLDWFIALGKENRQLSETHNVPDKLCDGQEANNEGLL